MEILTAQFSRMVCYKFKIVLHRHRNWVFEGVIAGYLVVAGEERFFWIGIFNKRINTVMSSPPMLCFLRIRRHRNLWRTEKRKQKNPRTFVLFLQEWLQACLRGSPKWIRKTTQQLNLEKTGIESAVWDTSQCKSTPINPTIVCAATQSQSLPKWTNVLTYHDRCEQSTQ